VAKRKLHIYWGDGAVLKKKNQNPKYLGVTLDRSLTYKEHCEKKRLNVNTKLVGSAWGAETHTVGITALLLWFSAG